jgi:hypothetical protein
MAKKELPVVPLVGTVDERRAAALSTLNEMDPDYEIFYEKLSAKKKERIHRSMSHLRSGLHTVAPLTCLGPSKCPFIEHCPIPERNADGTLELGPPSEYPMYRSCVFELFYMQQKVLQYVEHLQVDPANPVEMALVNDLAVIDLYKNRAMLVMSAGDTDGDGRDFMKKNVMEQQGEHGTLTSTQTQLHPAAQYIDTLEKRRDRILTSLIETRKTKADMSVKLGQGRADSALREELLAVRRALEAAVGVSQIPGAKSIQEQPLYIDDDEE